MTKIYVYEKEEFKNLQRYPAAFRAGCIGKRHTPGISSRRVIPWHWEHILDMAAHHRIPYHDGFGGMACPVELERGEHMVSSFQDSPVSRIQGHGRLLLSDGCQWSNRGSFVVALWPCRHRRAAWKDRFRICCLHSAAYHETQTMVRL